MTDVNRTIYLLHGRSGGPGGSVLLLEELLRNSGLEGRYTRPSLPHGREQGVQPAECSLHYLRTLEIEPGALLIGISMGGLVAAKLQEDGRDDLCVICISSPTWADGVALTNKLPNRLALYSSVDEVIAGRTQNWPKLAEAYDLPWLSHDTDAHRERFIPLVIAYLKRSGIMVDSGQAQLDPRIV